MLAAIKANVVEWLMSMPSVRVFSSSDLTICFGLASRDYTHVGSAFYALYFFKTFSVLWLTV